MIHLHFEIDKLRIIIWASCKTHFLNEWFIKEWFIKEWIILNCFYWASLISYSLFPIPYSHNILEFCKNLIY